MELSRTVEPLVTLTVLTGLKFTVLYALSKCSKKQKRKVGKLSRVTIFPVKSMRGINMAEATCRYTGLVSEPIKDRCFMVVDDKLAFLSARKLSRMSAITATSDGKTLVLTAAWTRSITIRIPTEGSDPVLNVTIWDEPVEGLDCGERVSLWLDETLGRKGLKLVYNSDGLSKRKCTDGPTSWHKNAKPDDKVSYQDGFPFMLMTGASLCELNSRLQEPVKIDNFRPNFVVEGCGPYDENLWDKIFIGDAQFTNISHCRRCIMTTVDPATGTRHPRMEPLRTLKSYRLLEPELEDSPCYGINLVVDRPGKVTAGDTVYATFK